MSSETIDRLRVHSAEELLDALRPAQRRWHPDPRAWIFRGHADSEWALLAKAYRVAQKPYAPFGVECRLDGSAQEWSAYSLAERRMLERFSEGLDRAGLARPVRAVEVSPPGRQKMSDADTHPDNIPLLALAQHFGLPTKLLDWSRQSKVAAYFAAAEAAKRPEDGKDLAVWALRLDFVASMDDRAVDRTELSVRTAPAASNPNLHAQQGLFTRTEGENGHRLPVDVFVERAAQEAKAATFTGWEREKGRDPTAVPRPLMQQLRLPQLEAPKLLRLLAYEGVTGATMFPGYEGVVRAMVEEVLWDTGRRP